MKRADQRQVGRAAERVPADQRNDRLVQVHDVVCAVAQLTTQGEHRGRARGDVRDRAVGRDADRAPQRDKALGLVARLRTSAPVQTPCERVIGVIRREDPHVVILRAKLSRQRLDMARDPARIGPRVRRHERDPHSATLYPPQGSIVASPRGRDSRRAIARCDNRPVSARHFVKYTFLKLDPAWRRRDAAERERDKRELMAACEDFADGHLLQSFSLVGTRGDAELLLIAEAENLQRIHELHVVLAQSGLMHWASTPFRSSGCAKLGVLRGRAHLAARVRGRYVFVYPFVKSREWYALPADERWRIMQQHIEVGREYPGVDNHTTYSFGLDDQEFVVAFDTDDVGTFLDLVQRLRSTEASRYTVRDTPSFTCIRMSLERALNALDGEPLAFPSAVV